MATSRHRYPSGDLVARVADGSETAFAELCATVAAPIAGVAQRVLRDAAMAEDVSQEVLVELWRTAPRYRPERGSVLTWACTIAHRRAVDEVRRTTARRHREHRFGASHTERDIDTVHETASAHWETDQVRRYLRSLTHLQRQSIELVFYRGHTYAEVAQSLNTSVNTVKTRIRDGLLRLHTLLTTEKPYSPAARQQTS